MRRESSRIWKKNKRKRKAAGIGIAVVFVAIMIGACGMRAMTDTTREGTEESTAAGKETAAAEPSSEPETTTQAATEEETKETQPETSQPASEPQEPPVQEPSGEPAPEPKGEEDDFSDAAFVGDSRTDGLLINTGLYTAQFYTANGLMVNTAQTDPVIRLENGNKGTVLDALAQHAFQRVYIMFGVNELGWYSGESFKEEYTKLIQNVRKIQPQAEIYIQSILPVSREKSEGDAIYNNANVRKFNGWIQEVAAAEGVTYLDVASAVSDAQGDLPEGGSTDGVHLSKSYCEIWLAYLRQEN
jgi:lysophospholipase L1-like esterase